MQQTDDAMTDLLERLDTSIDVPDVQESVEATPQAQQVPQMHQLYRHFNKDGALLYVGISLSAIYRLSQHKDSSHWYEEIASLTIENFGSREDLHKAERLAIAEEKPLHNKHRYERKQSRREAIALQEKSENSQISRAFLTNRIVTFQPFYTPQDAARVFQVKAGMINRWMDEGVMPYVEVEGAPRVGKYIGLPVKIHRRITGWQMIDFIERWEKNRVPDAR